MDEEHFIRFHDKNAVFKFVRLSVNGRPIRRKSYVFKFIRVSVDVALAGQCFPAQLYKVMIHSINISHHFAQCLFVVPQFYNGK